MKQVRNHSQPTERYNGSGGPIITMRRITFALIVVFVALALPALAQEEQESAPVLASINFTEPKPLRKVIEVIAKATNYRVEGLENIPASIMWQDAIEITDAGETLREMLEEAGIDAIVDPAKKIVLIRQKPGAPTAQRAAQTQPSTTTLQQAAGVRMCDGWTISQDTIDTLRVVGDEQYVGELIAEENWRRCGRRRTGGRSFGFPVDSRTGAYDYGYGSLYPWMVGCQDGRPSSFLEFQYRGKRGEKHLWLISINGVGPGTVDQGDTLSQRLPVCSDAAVTVTVEKIGERRRWERQYSLRPFASTEVPVGEFLFDDTLRVSTPRVRR